MYSKVEGNKKHARLLFIEELYSAPFSAIFTWILMFVSELIFLSENKEFE